jgi:hypothetical protein
MMPIVMRRKAEWAMTLGRHGARGVQGTTVVGADTVAISYLASLASQTDPVARRRLIFGTNWHSHSLALGGGARIGAGHG